MSVSGQYRAECGASSSPRPGLQLGTAGTPEQAGARRHHTPTPGSRPGQVESVVVWCSAAVRGVPRRCAQWQRYVRRLVDNGTSYPWSRAPQSAAAAPPCSDTWTRGTPCSPPSPCWPPAWPSPSPGTSTDSPSSSTRIPRMYSTALRLVYTLLQLRTPTHLLLYSRFKYSKTQM